jgi:NADH-quinone oxidoreductase subunit C
VADDSSLTPAPSPVEDLGRGENEKAAAPAPDDPRVERLRAQFGDKLLEAEVSARELSFLVEPDVLPEFVLALRQEILAAQHGFTDACGVEREDSYECLYRFALVSEPLRVAVRVQTPKAKAVLPTLTHLYKGALWPEREFAEMFGVLMTGHPDLRHLLLPEDWPGFPLRKDYVYPLEHPWIAPDPLRDDPEAALSLAAEGEGETAE